MNKNDYNKLNLEKQIEYVNNKLKTGESLRNISLKLELSKITIRDRFKKINYEFDKELRQYIKVENEEKYKTTTKVVNEKPVIKNNEIDKNYKDSALVLNDKNENAMAEKKEIKLDETTENYKSSGLVLNKKIQKEILELLELKEDIKVLIEEHKRNQNVIDIPELKLEIDTAVLNGEAVNRSLKIYTTVYKELQELYEIYPQFNKYDIISQAIHEFYDKYKK